MAKRSKPLTSLQQEYAHQLRLLRERYKSALEKGFALKGAERYLPKQGERIDKKFIRKQTHLREKIERIKNITWEKSAVQIPIQEKEFASYVSDLIEHIEQYTPEYEQSPYQRNDRLYKISQTRQELERIVYSAAYNYGWNQLGRYISDPQRFQQLRELAGEALEASRQPIRKMNIDAFAIIFNLGKPLSREQSEKLSQEGVMTFDTDEIYDEENDEEY